MKIIDLLNKIANGEEVPKKFGYGLFELYRTKSNDIRRYYVDKEGMFFFEEYSYDLTDEIEIIEEEKKIEKIDLSEWAEITYQEDWEMLTKDFNRNCNLFVNKINGIIDYLKSKGE